MTEQPLVFTGGSSIQFLIHCLLLTQLLRLPGITYHLLCSNCISYRTACHSIGHQMLPTQLLHREEENFHRGGKYPTVMSLSTYVAYFPPKGITW